MDDHGEVEILFLSAAAWIGRHRPGDLELYHPFSIVNATVPGRERGSAVVEVFLFPVFRVERIVLLREPDASAVPHADIVKLYEQQEQALWGKILTPTSLRSQ